MAKITAVQYYMNLIRGTSSVATCAVQNNKVSEIILHTDYPPITGWPLIIVFGFEADSVNTTSIVYTCTLKTVHFYFYI